MQRDLMGLFPWAFIATINLLGLSIMANAGEQGSASYPTSPSVVTTGTPTPGENGTGTGMGTGRAGPGYGGRYSSDPTHLPDHREAVPSSRRFGRPGYGRSGRGYGYGYPGYRGQGGSRYPQHRQYANPPRYPVTTRPGEQAAPRQ